MSPNAVDPRRSAPYRIYFWSNENTGNGASAGSELSIGSAGAAPATAAPAVAAPPVTAAPLSETMATPYFQTGDAGAGATAFAAEKWSEARTAFERARQPATGADAARLDVLLGLCNAQLGNWAASATQLTAARKALPLLTDYLSYADARQHCNSEALWALFDGGREKLNIAHECIDRHAGAGRVAVAELSARSFRAFAGLAALAR